MLSFCQFGKHEFIANTKTESQNTQSQVIKKHSSDMYAEQSRLDCVDNVSGNGIKISNKNRFYIFFVFGHFELKEAFFAESLPLPVR